VALFQTLPILTSEEESYFIKLNPVTSLQLEAPLLFEYDIPENFFADPTQMYLYLKSKIVDSDHKAIPKPDDGADVPSKAQVYPIPYFANTCFSNVEMFLNNTQIGSSNNLYPFRAYMESTLSFDKGTKDSQLSMGFFYPDTKKIDFGDIGDNLTRATCENKGARKRWLLTRYSSSFETFSKLHLDLCSQNKYILNRTNMKLKCYRATNNFALMAKDNDEKYKVIFEEAFVYLRIVRLRESLRLGIESNLLKMPAKYPMKKIETRFFTHSSNTSNLSEQNLFTGTLPTRVVIGLVSTLALDGKNTLSPFHFKHCNMQNIELRVNGRALPTPDGISVDMEKKLYTQAYASIFLGSGGFFENSSPLTYEEYREGNFLIMFDLTEDFNNEPTHFHNPNSGTLSLKIRLAEATTESVSIICMFEHEVIMNVDSDRNYWLQE
jgi:hypothetical protein